MEYLSSVIVQTQKCTRISSRSAPILMTLVSNKNQKEESTTPHRPTSLLRNLSTETTKKRLQPTFNLYLTAEDINWYRMLLDLVVFVASAGGILLYITITIAARWNHPWNHQVMGLDTEIVFVMSWKVGTYPEQINWQIQFLLEWWKIIWTFFQLSKYYRCIESRGNLHH